MRLTIGRSRYGYVEAVESLGSGPASPGIGAIGGAVVGGVLGNQVGHGTGGQPRRSAVRSSAALSDTRRRKPSRGRSGRGYRFRVRMDDGTYQTFTQEPQENLRVGDRVRIENGRVWPA